MKTSTSYQFAIPPYTSRTLSLVITHDDTLDMDKDLLPDDWEMNYADSLDVLTRWDDDYDSDKLSNWCEYVYGCNPANSDTDGDGILDGEEEDTVCKADAAAVPGLQQLGIILLIFVMIACSFLVYHRKHGLRT